MSSHDDHHETSLFRTKAFRQGISFGVVSSAMTVLGISLGMWSSAGKLRAIVASIIGLSISNSLADAFSMYMSGHSHGRIQECADLRSCDRQYRVRFTVRLPCPIPNYETQACCRT